MEDKNKTVGQVLEGLTLKEMYLQVSKNYNRLLKKMDKKFGDRVWNEEKDKFFTAKEKEWLQMGMMFSRMAKGQ